MNHHRSNEERWHLNYSNWREHAQFTMWWISKQSNPDVAPHSAGILCLRSKSLRTAVVFELQSWQTQTLNPKIPNHKSLQPGLQLLRTRLHKILHFSALCEATSGFGRSRKQNGTSEQDHFVFPRIEKRAKYLSTKLKREISQSFG